MFPSRISPPWALSGPPWVDFSGATLSPLTFVAVTLGTTCDNAWELNRAALNSSTVVDSYSLALDVSELPVNGPYSVRVVRVAV